MEATGKLTQAQAEPRPQPRPNPIPNPIPIPNPNPNPGPSELGESASQRALRRLTFLSFQLYDGLRLAAPHLSARPEQQLPFLHAAAVALYQPLASCAFDAQQCDGGGGGAPIDAALDAALQPMVRGARANPNPNPNLNLNLDPNPNLNPNPNLTPKA